MLPFLITSLVLAAPAEHLSVDQARSFIEMLESMQPQLHDFRCEYEGTIVYKSEKIRKKLKLGDRGVSESFNGIFIWKSGGDTAIDCYHRNETSGHITRERLVVRPAKGEAEHIVKQDTESTARATVSAPHRINSNRPTSLGSIFLIDTIKSFLKMDDMEFTTEDEMLEDRKLKVLSVSFKGAAHPYQRFWLDMPRGGLVARHEAFEPRGALLGRSDIKLAPFKVGETQVWMPVSAVAESHSAFDNGKPSYPTEPTMIATIYIVNGTLEFNQRPGPAVFRLDFKPGTPVSDSLRRLEYEFGQQQPPARASKRQAEAMLLEQLAQAERQRTELSASSPSRNGPGWSTWLVWVFGGSALVASVVLLIKRRR